MPRLARVIGLGSPLEGALQEGDQVGPPLQKLVKAVLVEDAEERLLGAVQRPLQPTGRGNRARIRLRAEALDQVEVRLGPADQPL